MQRRVFGADESGEMKDLRVIFGPGKREKVERNCSEKKILLLRLREWFFPRQDGAGPYNVY